MGSWRIQLAAVLVLNAQLAAQSYRLHGLNFSPYQDGQSPDARTPIGEEQIRQRLAVVAPYTQWVRTFGAADGLEQIPRLAREVGLKVAMGAWISSDLAANEQQIQRLIDAGKFGFVDLAIVGSEVLLRRNLTAAQLIGYIQRVKQALPGIPVATADVYLALLENPAVIAAGDVVLVNYYPYWEGYAVNLAVPVLHGWHQRVAQAAGGKPVIVAETGWPSGGSPVGSAVPSLANANQFFLNFVSWARANNVPYFYFEAFDETWKTAYEGPQGATWGLWTKDGTLKAGMQPVFDGATTGDNWSGQTAPGGPGTPRIELTYIPAYGNLAELLQGQVWHVAPAQYRVAVYIQVNNLWWTKPYADQPLTSILGGGSFLTDIVTGGNDQQATRIIAFLVPDSYSPPQVLGSQQLPTSVYANAVAYQEAVRTPDSVGGRVTDEFGAGMGGVRLQLSCGGAPQTITEAAGYYSFPNVPAGASCTVTPSRAGFRFVPPSGTAAPVVGNARVNFVASALPTAPALLSPFDGWANVPLNQVLTWLGGTLATGYEVYLGTSPNPPLIGGTTETTLAAPLLPSLQYYWRVVSRNTAGTASSPVWTFTTRSDTDAPTIVIESPTSLPAFATNSTPIALSGNSTDNISVVQVTWANDRGGSGLATMLPACAALGCPNPWTVPAIPLQPGTNVITVTARDAHNNTATDTLTVEYTPGTAPPPVAHGLRFVPLAPCRLVETRPEYNFQGRTGVFGPPFFQAGETRVLTPANSTVCSVPAAAKAYLLNVTVVPRGPLDYVTVWPGDTPRPTFWTVRAPDGVTVANTALVRKGSNGSIQVYASDATDLVIDLTGYFTDDPQLSNLVFYPLTPCRVVETRVVYRPEAGPFGPPTMEAGETRRFRLPASPHCAVPLGAAAYSVTVTVVPPQPLAFLTTWPAGGSPPNVSSLNSPQGRILANSIIVPGGAEGAIDVFVLDRSDVLVDINGYFAPDDGHTGLFYFPVTQCRVADTTDAAYLGAFGPPALANETSRMFPILGSTACPNIPNTAKAFAVNLTALPGGSPMPFLTAWPSDRGRPNASQLNAFDGQVVTNSAIVPASANGAINVYAYRQTNLVVELSGYFGR